jgi:hypothetical protein
LLFAFVSTRYQINSSKLYLEQLDAPLIMDFHADLEAPHAIDPLPISYAQPPSIDQAAAICPGSTPALSESSAVAK